jgi:phosphoribosylamine-glycine ligase
MTRAYDAASHISFEGIHYRRDIAHRGLKRSRVLRDGRP